MYQQKFTPYSQMGQVYEEQEYEQEDSQPLIEEVDPDYQPTDKQVKEYAIEILGMRLPEDQRLMYLARQGLKAPLPENWTPYQSRDGTVYYKHKITQQKTFQHPTDVEYRKKYTQQKQRAARKNLKSMNLKGNPLAGFGQPLGQPSAFGALGSKIGINPLGLSNISSSQQEYQTISKQMPKLDPKLEQNLMRQVHELEDKLQKQMQQFERQRKSAHEKNMKKYKADFEASLSELKSQKSSVASYQKSLKQEKQRMKERLKQAYDDRFKDEFVQVEKQEEKKYREFVELYEEDNKIKLKKYEVDRERDFVQRTKKLQSLEKKHQQNKRQKQKQRQAAIIQARQKYQKQGNEQIQAVTRETFVKQLDKIKDTHRQKIRQFEQKLENEYEQMKRLLGHDPNKALQQMAEKKSRLKRLSQQKLQSMKKKQYQRISQSFTEQLQQSLLQLQSSLQLQHTHQLQAHKASLKQKLSTLKSNFQKQFQQKLDRQTQQIYTNAKKSTSQYQKQKHKKIMQIRQQYIEEIVRKGQSKSQQLMVKMSVREKGEMIENKEELIGSLGRQVELEAVVLRQLRMNKAIVTAANVDDQLKRLISQLGITYKPQQFLTHQQRYNQLLLKYKSDKHLLGSMMTQLQNTAFTPFYLNKKSTTNYGYDDDNDYRTATTTTAMLTKQYNKDVRTMRRNEEMLGRYEVVLRRAEMNQQQALRELEGQGFEYEEISLRVEARSGVNDSSEPQLKEIGNADYTLKDNNNKYAAESYTGFQSIEDRLQQHSKFLSHVKAELNRKLYKVRNSHFRV